MTDLTVIMRNYEATPILINFIKKRRAEGDKEAIQALKDWDMARDVSHLMEL